MRRPLAQLAGISSVLLLAACAERIEPPKADPGQPVTISTGSFVRLDGGGSKDSQGRALAYDWSIVSRPPGSTTTLVDAHTATPTFKADLPGDYTLQLIVSNSVMASAPALVKITVTTCGAGVPVVSAIRAGRARYVIGDVIQLSADVTDPDSAAGCGQTQPLAWSWKVVQQPSGSTTQLNSPTGENPSLDADRGGDFLFRLVVTDGTGRASNPRDFKVHVDDCGAATPVVTASATPDETKPTGQVQLTAAATDADDTCGVPQTITYRWTRGSSPEASTALLSSTTIPNPTFTPDRPGDYEFLVFASDQSGRTSAPASVRVRASTCSEILPTVGGIDQVSGGGAVPPGGVIGTAVSVRGRNVADTNCLAIGTPKSQWTLVAPKGSRAVLSDPAAAMPSFLPDLPGAYQLTLRVKDSEGKVSEPAFLNVPVADCTAAPIAWAAEPVSATVADPQIAGSFTYSDATRANVGARVTLQPSASVPAYCGALPTGPLKYAWAIVTRPSASAAALDAAGADAPSFTPDLPGDYAVAVTATDARGKKSAPQLVTIRTTGCGRNAASIALVSRPDLAPFSSSALSPQALRSYTPFDLRALLLTDDNVSCPARFAVSATFSWSLSSAPPAGVGLLGAPAGADSSFQALAPGAYAVRIDAAASSAAGPVAVPSAFAYFAASACGAQVPQLLGAVAKQGGNAISRAAIQQQVEVVATGFDADRDAACKLGDGSTPGGDLTYEWSLVSAPAGSSLRAEQADGTDKFYFTPDVAGTFVYRVVARDDHGLQSAPVLVTVPTGPCGPAVGDVAVHTTPQVGTWLRFDPPAGISDVCVASPRLTYSWSLTARPANSSSVLVSANDPQNANSIALTPDQPGQYTVQLIVGDQGGHATAVTKTFVLSRCGKPQVSNARFSVGGVPQQTAHHGDLVELAVDVATQQCGAKSNEFAYGWKISQRPSGSTSSLSAPAAVNPSLVADGYGGSFQVLVTVTDGLGVASDPFPVTVPVSNCGNNVPSIGMPSLGARDGMGAFDPYALTAGAVSNADDSAACPARFNQSPYTLSWAVTSPVNADSTLSSTTGPAVTFAPKQNGAFVVELVATGKNGKASAPAKRTIDVDCQLPGFTLGAPQQRLGDGSLGEATVYRGDRVRLASALAASCRVAVPDQYRYAWTLLEAPAGSTASLNSAQAVEPEFVADVAGGTYRLQLQATDSLGNTATSPVKTIVVSACGSRRPTTSVTVARPSGTKAFDPFVLTAVEPVDNPDDACPDRFKGAPYRFAWSVAGPNLPHTLSASAGSAVTFAASESAQFTLQLTVLGANGMASLPIPVVLDAECRDGQGALQAPIGLASPAIGIVPPAGQTLPLANVANVGDRLALSAAPVARCRSAETFSYRWTVVEKPARSGAQLTSAVVASPSLTVDAPRGRVSVKVDVTDSLGHTASGAASVDVSPCGDNPVVADATASSGMPFDPRTLTATASSEDDDALKCPARFKQSYQYGWTAGPSAQPGTFSAPGAATTTFRPGGSQVYSLQVAVRGSNGHTATVPVSVDATCNGPFVSATAGVPSYAGPQQGAFPRSASNVFRGDVVTVSASGQSSCFSAGNAGLAVDWTLTRPDGSTVPLATGGTASFTVDQPSATYAANATVRDALGNSVALPPQAFTARSCGANAINPAIQVTAGAAPFDDVTLQAVPASGSYFSADDDPAVCPAVFANGYAQRWSVPSSAPAVGHVLDRTVGPTVKLTPGGNAVYNVALVVSAGQRTGQALRQVTVSCPDVKPKTGAIRLAGEDEANFPGKFFAGGTATLSAQPGSLCYSPGSTPYSYLWSLAAPAGSASLLSSTTAAVTSFVADASMPGGTWTATVTVVDKLGNRSNPTVTPFQAQTCGASPIFAAIAATSAGKAFDPHALTATPAPGRAFFSDDLDPSRCPARFAQTFSFAWDVTPPEGTPASMYELTPSAGTATFAAGANGSYGVALTVTGSSHGTATVTRPFNVDCQALSPVLTAPAAVSVSDPDGYLMPGHFFAGDTVTVQAVASNDTCYSAGNFQPTYGWSLASNDGNATIAASTAGSTTFTASATGWGKGYEVTADVADQWGHAAQQKTSFTSDLCGANAVGVTRTIAQNSGSKAFDPWTLSAVASSKDDSGAYCPPRFGQTYTFAWSATPPQNATHLSLTGTNPATFSAGDNGTYGVSVVATGVKSGIPGTASGDIVVACGNPNPVFVSQKVTQSNPAAGIANVQPAGNDGFPYGSGQFFRDDTVTVSAPVEWACFTGNNVQPVWTWAIDLPNDAGGTPPPLQNASSATPKFVANAPERAFRTSVTVKDQWDHSSAGSGTFTSDLCGFRPVNPFVSAASIPLPMDPQTLTVTPAAPHAYVTDDNDPSICPLRFRSVTLTYAWTLDSGAATLSPTNAPSATFTPTAFGSSSVSVGVTASNGRSAGANRPISVSCDQAPATPVVSTNPAGPVGVGDSLTASVATASRCKTNGALTYQWSLAQPAGGTDAYSSPTVAAPTLTVNKSGFYDLSVTVGDAFAPQTLSAASSQLRLVAGATAATGAMARGRAQGSAILLGNGKVLIAGGYAQPACCTDVADATADLYDVSANAGAGGFTATGSMGTGRARTAVTLLADGRALVAGGASYDGNGSGVMLASTELYDSGLGTFAAGPTLGAARADATATLLPNGKVLITGGTSAMTPQATTDLLTFSSGDGGSRTAGPDMTAARKSHTATLLSDGRVLIAGGYDNGALASAEIYNPTTNAFSSAGAMLAGRYGHTATRLANGKVLLAGGADSTGAALASAELFDPSANNGAGGFVATGALAAARAWATATRMRNGKVLIAGGLGSSSQPLYELELFDPAGAGNAGSFGSAGILRFPTFQAMSAPLPTGDVLVAGGAGGAPYHARAEVFRRTAGTAAFAAAGNSMANPTAYGSAALLGSGKALVVGGLNGNPSPAVALQAASLFDGAGSSGAGSFAATGSLATGRYYTSATTLPNGNVVVLGGRGVSNTSYFSSGEIYDGSVFSTLSSSMSVTRAQHAAVLLRNGKVLIAGGTNNSQIHASAELFQPNSFSATGSLNHPRTAPLAVLLPNGKVLIAGGSGCTTNATACTFSAPLSSAEVYDPDTGVFTLLTGTGSSMSSARVFATATLLPNGRVLIAGGDAGSGALKTADVFNPATNTFSAVGDLTTNRRDAMATLLPNGKVLIAGGLGTNNRLQTAELFDWRTSSFTATGQLTTQRMNAVMVVLGNGRVVVAGGIKNGNNNQYLSSADVYDP